MGLELNILNLKLYLMRYKLHCGTTTMFIKITSVNPKKLAEIGIEFKEKLSKLEKELNNYLLKLGFEVSYHYELNTLKLSTKDIKDILELTGVKPVLAFPVLRIKPEREIYDAFILEDGKVVLRNTLIRKNALVQQYYILTKKGLERIVKKSNKISL